MFLTILYLATRIWNILRLPPFVDELLYIRWTDAIAQNLHLAWLPVSEDGQPPLFFWLGATIKYITHLDTILILRLLSISAGVLTLILLIQLGTKLFNKQIGFLLGFSYTLFPMFLWYDRLGMRESFITLSGLIMIYGLVDRFIFHQPKSSYLILLGFALGIATKGTAIIFLPVILVALLLHRRGLKLNKHDLVAFILFGSLLSLLYFGAESIITKGETFLLSPSLMIGRIYPNFYSTALWILQYSTLPVVLLGLAGLVALYYHKSKSNLLFAIILVVTLGIEIVTASIYFPRYFLWVLIIWLVPIAYGASLLIHKKVGLLFLALLSIPMFIFDIQIIFSTVSPSLPAIERWQYVTGWPSGFGIASMAEAVSKIPIDIMVVEPNEACKTGLPYYGANNYSTVLVGDVSIINQAVADGKNVYLCLNIEGNYDFDGISKLVLKVERPGSESSLRLYKLTKNTL
jgi:4-amino-4-deoxy-L-arabinose transferase-like glycosyltransferase